MLDQTSWRQRLLSRHRAQSPTAVSAGAGPMQASGARSGAGYRVRDLMAKPQPSMFDTQSDLVPSVAGVQLQFGNTDDHEHAEQFPVAAWARTLADQPLLSSPADAEYTAHLEADIMASVVSTELAAFGYAAPIAERHAAVSDIAASVLSTELATYAP